MTTLNGTFTRSALVKLGDDDESLRPLLARAIKQLDEVIGITGLQYAIIIDDGALGKLVNIEG